MHTGLLKHFVALVENEHAEVREVKVALLDEGQDAARSAHDDVGLLETLEKSHVLVDRHAAVDDLGADVRQLRLESLELLLDLVGELSVVAED